MLIINQDAGLLATAREAMLKRKLDEKTIQHRMNNYTAHIAFHLWQMYQQVQKIKELQAMDAHSDEADQLFRSDADHLRSEATQSSLSVEQ